MLQELNKKMRSLTEDEVKTLMQSDAYQNRNNPSLEAMTKQVTQGWENLYPEDDRNKYPEKYNNILM